MHLSDVHMAVGDVTELARKFGGIVVRERAKRNRNNSSKGKSKAKNAVSDGAPENKMPVNMVTVRENIESLVWQAAEKIVKQLIAAAEKGQVAPTKYLFEAVGLYPATKEANGREDSVAYALFKRMGLPPAAGEGNSVASGAVGGGEGKESAKKAEP